MRALTPEQKRAVIERLYAAWLASPTQRLGQLILNAAITDVRLFYVEDFPLIEALESRVKEKWL